MSVIICVLLAFLVGSGLKPILMAHMQTAARCSPGLSGWEWIETLLTLLKTRTYKGSPGLSGWEWIET